MRMLAKFALASELFWKVPLKNGLKFRILRTNQFESALGTWVLNVRHYICMSEVFVNSDSKQSKE